MMSLGAIGFTAPWLLTALVLLPAIWWLLRFTPPRPMRVRFPATRLLRGLVNAQRSPSKSPWWLTALRVLLAGLIIGALAGPVHNPSAEDQPLTKPVALLVDNGWASGSTWSARVEAAGRIIDRASEAGQPVYLVPTATGPRVTTPSPLAAEDARQGLLGLVPQPYAPDRLAALERLAGTLPDPATVAIYWLSDGLAHPGLGADGAASQPANAADQAVLDRMAAIAGGDITVLRPDANDRALGLSMIRQADGGISAAILRAEPEGARTGQIIARTARGEVLAAEAFTLDAGSVRSETAISLPLELRNQIARLEIAGERSAGAVYLLDGASQWRRVGLVSGETQEQSQPLLSPLYYINRALAPYADVLDPGAMAADRAIDQLMTRGANVIALADIGRLPSETLDALTDWVERGGTLVRFAGPRLEQASDPLLPTPLRLGGRVLGGALSWSTPQALAPFDAESLFAGLAVPQEVTVSRQVLADPARLAPEIRIWARLADGTPLVTAAPLGRGRTVLFHVTANSDWSNLPLSGLFVDMLRRMVDTAETVTDARNRAPAATEARDDRGMGHERPAGSALLPVATLNGRGELGAPSTDARAIAVDQFAATGGAGRLIPSSAHPPGLYGEGTSRRALNLMADTTALVSHGTPDGARAMAYGAQGSTPLKPWLFAAAFGLFLIDALAVLGLAVLGRRAGLRSKAALAGRPAATAAILTLLISGLSMAAMPSTARAEPANHDAAAEAAAEARALEATLTTRFAFVITGDGEADRTSEAGLNGLNRILTLRTAVEPAPAVGVDIEVDELAFYPVLYWPVLSDTAPLTDTALAKIDSYMKNGGMIVFDTRDQHLAIGTGDGGPGNRALQRLLQRLDLPPLEPVPLDHVLTKSFYLLSTFPGRYDGGQLWVEATPRDAEENANRARQADGVTAILITANDLAAAWAIDERGRPLFPVVPGGEAQREIAYRVGVNIALYALTGNYKADQVHVPALLQRLGQ